MMTKGNKNLFNSIILFSAFLSLTGFTITEKEREIAENDPLATMLLISKAGVEGLGVSKTLLILSVFRKYVDSGRYEEAAALIAADPLSLFERLSALKDVEIKLKEGLGNDKFSLLLDRQKTEVFNLKEGTNQRVMNLIALAPLYIQIGEKGKGISLLLEALNEIDSLPEAHSRASDLSSLALEFSRIGDNIRASGLFDRAVKEARALKKEAFDALYENIAISMLQSGSNQKALEFINSTDFRFAQNKSNVLLEIADHFYKSNNKKEALDLMQNVFILYQQSEKSKDTEYRIGKFIELANIYSAIAKPNESIELLSKAETLLRNSYPDNTWTMNLGPMA
jgi:tetratricopeptide (TPR) repeat protein